MDSTANKKKVKYEKYCGYQPKLRQDKQKKDKKYGCDTKKDEIEDRSLPFIIVVIVIVHIESRPL